MINKICVKCGIKKGHACGICYGPITSFGLIVYGKKKDVQKTGEMYSNTFNYSCESEHVTENEKYCIYKNNKNKGYSPTKDELYFLLVERKDSISFIGLIQGVYPDDFYKKNLKIKEYVNNLTCEERYKINNFNWNDLWNIAGSNKKNKFMLEKKFNNVKETISSYLSDTKCKYRQANYLMPKGRLKFKETTIQCAIREFSEETGYSQDDITLENVEPFEEKFIGINGNTYKNVFYVARIKSTATIDIPLNEIKEQIKEVRNVGWFNLNESMDKIRNPIKKRILYNAYNTINAINEDNK